MCSPEQSLSNTDQESDDSQKVGPITLNFNNTECPTPPILHTPGIKQIPRLDQVYPSKHVSLMVAFYCV